MARDSLNRTLSIVLDRLMRERGLSNNELGRKAKVAPNTVANYRDQESAFTAKGKPRSAKLAEVEQIADALGIDPLDLLVDQPTAPTRNAMVSPPSISEQAVRFLERLDTAEQSVILEELKLRVARAIGLKQIESESVIDPSSPVKLPDGRERRNPTSVWGGSERRGRRRET